MGISLGLATLAASLVFGIWYPYPYRDISGGKSLFLLVVAVDVVMGPLLTLAVFNRQKNPRELRLDLAFIGALQLGALAYGLWTVAVARPVHLVFEMDRFRVVHSIDVEPEILKHAPAEWQQLPLMGPTLISVRDFKNSDESMDVTMAALQGLHPSARPDFWQSYEKAKPQILAQAGSLEDLKKKFPDRVVDIDQALATFSSQGRSVDSVGYFPLVSRSSIFWTVLLDKQTAEVIAFVPLDPF